MSTEILVRSTSRQDRGNWRHALLFLSLVTMEALWLGPWIHYMLASPILDNPIPMPLYSMMIIILGNMLVGLVVRRSLVYYRVAFKRHQLPIVLILISAVLATVAIAPALLTDAGDISFDYGAAFSTAQESVSALLPLGFIITPITIIAYSRGTMIGRYAPAPIAVGVTSRFAILMFFMVSILTVQADLQADMSVMLPFFFAAILLANALARSTSLRVSDAVRRVRFGRQWAMTLLGATIITVLVGMITASLFGGLNREQVQQILAIPVIILGAIGLVVAAPFLFVIGIIAESINFENIAPPEETVETGTRESVASRDNPQIDISDEINAITSSATTVILVSTVVIIIVVIVLFWLSYILAGEEEKLVEDGESISERENIGTSLLGNFRKLFSRLGNLPQGLGGNLFGVLTIRWAYARMERMGRKRGFPRPKAQTPYEYRTALKSAFPGGENYISTITNAYVAIRYGELPENERELEAVRKALDALKTLPEPQST